MSESEKRPLVSVVVLGDVGRSPRMRYHAASLAEEGFEVQMIGYAGSSIPEVEESDGKIFITHIREEPPASGTGWKRILSYFWKVMLLSFSLLGALHWLRPPKCVLVQNPPSIPALPVLWFYCLVTRARLVVDWHNYGYTILALALKSNHPLVKLCRWVEFAFGGRASASFCVTEALGKDLGQNGVKNAVTLYDRPASHFRPLSDEEKARFLDKMGKSYPSAFCQKEDPSINKFAELGEDGVFTLRKDRPGVVVSSTSWTEDEDFQMLLTALESYDATAARIDSRPELVVVITGKGPLKEKFVELMDTIPWKKITVITPWLEPGDYPLMLGSADLGVSLHSSSSGLDLPMKVVDMFGAGLPAAALGFDCIEELVQNGCNGVIFGNATELAASLSEWFNDGTFRDGSSESMHGKFRANTCTFAANGWHSNWRKIALPVIENL